MSESQDRPEFEELLRQFDEAVASLESDDLPLEVALSRYEAAVQLADKCARILENAEMRVREIDKTLERIDGAPEE